MSGSYLKQASLFIILSNICYLAALYRRSQWPFAGWDYGFECRPGPWVFVSCEYCVLSVRGLCEGLITRPEGSYRVWCVCVCVCVCDSEASTVRKLWPNRGYCVTNNLLCSMGRLRNLRIYKRRVINWQFRFTFTERSNSF